MSSVCWITRDLLHEVAVRAQQSPRQRMNHNFHADLSAPVHRLLNAIEPGSYIRPHRHLAPPKDEALLILQGQGALFWFDETGAVQEIFPLDPARGFFGADIPAGIYHTVISLQPGSVYFEVKQGPYQPINDKTFAPWAPAEGSPEALGYLTQLIQWAEAKMA